MPSSTSKQISYPCPIIGNSGDYIESAKVNWGHFVERFPKKVIFHFQKPEITDERLQALFESGEISAFVEFNSASTFNFFSKKLDFSKGDTFPIEINYGELNRKVRLRFFLASSKDIVINPQLLASDFPSSDFLAKELDMLGKSKAVTEYIDHNFDPFLSNASSIFMITPNDDADVKSQIVDFENDKINIKLPKETFKKYQFIKKDENIPMIHCAIAFPVLVDAFNLINKLDKSSNDLDDDDDIDKLNYSEIRWFMRLKEFKEIRNLRGDAYEMADKLLNNPVIKLINSNYLQDKNISEGDDYE